MVTLKFRALPVSTQGVIGQFYDPFSVTVRPAKFENLSCAPD